MKIVSYKNEDYLYCSTKNRFNRIKDNVEVYVKIGEIGELSVITDGGGFHPIEEISSYNNYTFSLITYSLVEGKMVMDMYGSELQHINHCPITNSTIPEKIREFIKNKIIDNNLERFV